MKFKNMLMFTILLIFIIVFCLFKIINKYLNPILLSISESETINLSTILINESVRNNTKNLENDVIKTVMDSEGNIIGIDFDIIKINNSLYNITNNIQNNFKLIENKSMLTNKELLSKYDTIIYDIPFGVILGNSILANLGPTIPVGASLIGEVTSDVKSEVIPYGINNSLIKIYVEVNLSSMIVLPFQSKKINNNSKILIGMKVIEGKIPNYYGNIITNTTPLVSNKEF